MSDIAKSVEKLPSPYVLRSVYYRRGEMSLGDGFDPTLPNQMLDSFNKITSGTVTTKEIEAELDGVPQTIRICSFATVFDFRSKLVEDGDVSLKTVDESQFVASITAEIVVDYLLTLEEFPPEELLHQWGSKNAIIHAWPYWREYCQNAQQRMNLPVSIIPLLIL